jgi:hypothetical protein
MATAGRALVAVAFLWAVFPACGWTWGGEGHRYIARNYSQHLPPGIDGLRTYDAVVEQKVTDPDTRKSYTPGESYRHYLDIDWYPEFLAGTLSHQRSVLEAKYGASVVLNNGVLPWAVGEVTATMTQQFQGAQFDALAVTIADLCHYVADGCQPLHCTKNYDGQYTGNNGIHSRYESTMLNQFLGGLHTDPMPVQYYPDAVDGMFDIITASWGWVDDVLAADNTAKAVSGGAYDALYYQALWHETEGFTQERLDEASRATASYVYTAWIDAGEPPVPNSTVAVGPPVAAAAGARLEAGPTPFRGELTVRFAGEGPLSVDVYDVRGARVARLADGISGGGTVTWRPAAARGGVAGVYFVRLSGPGVSLARRAISVP